MNPKIDEGLVWLAGGMGEHPTLALVILRFMLQTDGIIVISHPLLDIEQERTNGDF